MRVFRWLGRFTLVAGPVIVLLVFVLAAFLMWVLVTAPGTRWALTTAVHVMDGDIRGVQGSVWNGLRVDDVSLDFPGVSLRLEKVELRADWRRLLERQLHVHTLRVDTAWVDLRSSEKEPSEESDVPFSMPELPVSVRVDEAALAELILTQDDKPLAMTVEDVAAALVLAPAHGQLWLRRLSVATDSMEADLEGEVRLQELRHPWPGEVDLDVTLNGLRPAAPVCFHGMLPTLPVAEEQQQPITKLLAGVISQSCPVQLQAQARGSLESVVLDLQGGGQGMTLEANAELLPLQAMPLRHAELKLVLPDGSSLNGHANWEASVLSGELAAKKLDVGQLAGGAIPPAVLGFDSRFSLLLGEGQAVHGIELDLTFHEGSTWNEQTLAGRMAVNALLPAPEPTSSQPGPRPAPDDAESAQQDFSRLPALAAIELQQLNVDLTLGANRVHTEGGIGAQDSKLTLDVQAARLADFWPGLPGGVALKGDVAGALARHEIDLQGRYTQADANRTKVGEAPVAVQLRADGTWGGAPEGWRGRISQLQVGHAHLGLSLGAPVELSYFPGVAAPQWQWTVGPTELGFSVNQRPILGLRHALSRGGAGRWETQGDIDRIVVSPATLQQFGADFDIAALKKDSRGGVKVRGARSADDWEMVLGLDWALSFDGAHQGKLRLRRMSGDVMVPAEMPFPLELEALQLDVALVPSAAATSRLTAELAVDTRRMGRINASAVTVAHALPGGGITLNPSDPSTISVDAEVADLGWTSLLVGDALDIGGALQAKVKLDSRPDGSWNSAGNITGSNLRVVMIDQGVRLLDGTLRASLDNERLVLERLEFPARLRAEPKEWRTSEWVNTNPDAKGGYLVVSGDWNLVQSRGIIDAELYRFPIVQRADRYAMMTGALRVDAVLPDVAITGKLTADAGWFDLDMLGGIPTVDSDVVVIRPGEEQEVSVPLGISLDLEVDLGPRFYLTGYGLNSGLVGNMRVVMQQGKLTGIGALRTRGGAIEAYGQRLQLRRGAITFQGDITRPVLDIEALRTGLAVEAGVRVAGTARSPRIELVSYPAVSEIEKLSWLLLGHGPNDTGGDMALLFSVGSSFLSDGEPFYRRFGIDEVSMRSGELASVASVLPAESVVSGLDSGTSDIERRFINVSKRLGNGVTLSIRQALSETGTVARASYRLARGLTAEASVGTINGLALVYRWFSRERRPQTRN